MCFATTANVVSETKQLTVLADEIKNAVSCGCHQSNPHNGNFLSCESASKTTLRTAICSALASLPLFIEADSE